MTIVQSRVDLLSRPLCAFGQVDRLLGLHSGTARRWIDGYSRSGKDYPPMVRVNSTGDEIVTWGEFVETRLLSEYRHAGVPLIRMRPAIDVLRDELETPYHLAAAATWLGVAGGELVRRAQERVDLDARLTLVVVRSGQTTWSDEAAGFIESVEWGDNGDGKFIAALRPFASVEHVLIDPLHGFGEPVVRGARTEVIAELFRAGDPPEMIAELYELEVGMVNAALRYELLRKDYAAA